MTKNFINDESGYVQATIGLISTILISYVIFIAILPASDLLISCFSNMLDGNQFYTTTLQNRFDLAQRFGWKMPFGFIAIGFVFVIVRTIIKQRYTRQYSEDNY